MSADPWKDIAQALSKKNDRMKPFDYGMLYTEPMKNSWVGGYLNNPDNHEKNFVQRINTMADGASMSRPTEGGFENLRMANSGNQVFPTIEMRDGALQTLPRNQQPQETIVTATPGQAEVLAWNEYKRLNPSFNYGDAPPTLLELMSRSGGHR